MPQQPLHGADVRARQATHRRPDLVLMDRLMAVMDGSEGVRRIREHDDTSDVPVIAISASGLQERERWEAGSFGYLSGVDNITGGLPLTGRFHPRNGSSAGQAATRMASRQIWKRSLIVVRYSAALSKWRRGGRSQVGGAVPGNPSRELRSRTATGDGEMRSRCQLIANSNLAPPREAEGPDSVNAVGALSYCSSRGRTRTYDPLINSQML